VDVDLVVVEDAEEAATRGARLLAEAAAAGESIFFSGGSTPKRAYELAADADDDWTRGKAWWGDDRCVPPDDERSNFRLVQDSVLSRLARPPAEVHRIRGELEPEAAADEYDRLLEGVSIGLVLLGIGPDGHTASLFPNAPSLSVADRRVVAAEAALEPFVPRITLTLPAIAEASHVVFLVVGADKAGPVARAFGAPPSPDTPSSLARSRNGTTTVIVDRAAASLL
jgi:6-phosphogluconolactonase